MQKPMTPALAEVAHDRAQTAEPVAPVVEVRGNGEVARGREPVGLGPQIVAHAGEVGDHHDARPRGSGGRLGDVRRHHPLPGADVHLGRVRGHGSVSAARRRLRYGHKPRPPDGPSRGGSGTFASAPSGRPPFHWNRWGVGSGVRERRCRMPSRRWVAAVAVVAATAFVVRLAMVLRGAGLGGVFGYDDGVYYSASTSLLWGRMPYRDFLLLHPPGIVLALAPFAALGRLTSDATGFETARVGFMLVGSVNAGLVVVAARRLGLVAATAGGLFYALWVPVALTETTTRLEPLVSLGLLAALAVLANRVGETSRWAQVAAGCALGAAMAVKIWAAAPVAVVLVWCLWRLGPRATAR